MPDIAALERLLERLKAATGPDREIDAEVDCAIRYPDKRPARHDDFGGRLEVRPGHIKSRLGLREAARYTSSLDAAKIAVPDGHDYMLNSAQRYAVVWRTDAVPRTTMAHTSQAIAPTLELALCAAAVARRIEIAKQQQQASAAQ
jgi:hypothetical protein